MRLTLEIPLRNQSKTLITYCGISHRLDGEMVEEYTPRLINLAPLDINQSM